MVVWYYYWIIAVACVTDGGTGVCLRRLAEEGLICWTLDFWLPVVVSCKALMKVWVLESALFPTKLPPWVLISCVWLLSSTDLKISVSLFGCWVFDFLAAVSDGGGWLLLDLFSKALDMITWLEESRLCYSSGRTCWLFVWRPVTDASAGLLWVLPRTALDDVLRSCFPESGLGSFGTSFECLWSSFVS